MSVNSFAKVVKEVCRGGVVMRPAGVTLVKGRWRWWQSGKGGKLGLWRLLLLLLELDPPNPSQLTKEGFQGSRETQASPWPKGRGYKAE